MKIRTVFLAVILTVCTTQVLAEVSVGDKLVVSIPRSVIIVNFGGIRTERNVYGRGEEAHISIGDTIAVKAVRGSYVLVECEDLAVELRGSCSVGGLFLLKKAEFAEMERLYRQNLDQKQFESERYRKEDLIISKWERHRKAMTNLILANPLKNGPEAYVSGPCITSIIDQRSLNGGGDLEMIQTDLLYMSKLEVLGAYEDEYLVRYTQPKDRPGIGCPNGAILFVRKDGFNAMRTKRQEVCRELLEADSIMKSAGIVIVASKPAKTLTGVKVAKSHEGSKGDRLGNNLPETTIVIVIVALVGIVWWRVKAR